MFLACYFAHLPTGPPARSVFRLHNPRNGLPRSRLIPCLKPVACRYLPASPAAWSVSTPLRGFSPLWIEAFNECRCLPVHLPNPPDSRSLPDAFSIARCQLRITVPGPLRFRRLAVPQTSWNLPHYAPEIVWRQDFRVCFRHISTGLLRPVFNKIHGAAGGLHVEKTKCDVSVTCLARVSESFRYPWRSSDAAGRAK